MTTQGLRSFKARKEIENAELCGCYCCERMYVPETILDWVDNNLTAICPRCGIDSVVAYRPAEDGSIEIFKRKLAKWHLQSFGA